MTAATADRPRLAPPWSIALAAGLVGLALVLIYPYQSLLRRLLDAPPDELSAAYLANLLRADPEDPRLRLLLARSLMRSGRFDEVEPALAGARRSSDPAERRQAAWLLWQSRTARLDAAPPASPERRRLAAELAAGLPEMAGLDLPTADLVDLADRAFALGRPQIGLDLYERLARRSGDARLAGAGARAALAAGQYQAAARLSVLAARQAAVPADRRRHYLEAVQTLQSGDRLPEALATGAVALADMPALAADGEFLALLVELARAARRPDLADRYARMLLRMALWRQWQDEIRQQSLAARGFDALPRPAGFTAGTPSSGPRLPFDERAYRLGYQAFVDNGKLEDAWKVAASAVRQAPASLEWRRRLAQVSEWTGRPRLALEQWLHLARATDADEAWQAVLRLAPGLLDDAALKPALVREIARHPENRRLMDELLALYEREGDPAAARDFLERLYRSQPQPEILARLAELAERMGDDAGAAADWRGFFAAHGGPPPAPEAVRAATVLLRRDDATAAFDLLERASPTADRGDSTFWRLLAEVARLLQRDRKAIAAYRQALTGGGAEAGDFEALAQLLAADYPRQAAAVAAAAWRRFGRPADFLRALAGYAGTGEWSAVGALMDSVDRETAAALRGNPEFLRDAALYHRQRGNSGLARRELEAAFALAHGSAETRQALVWFLIDSNDAAALRRLLAAHEAQWAADPAMHDTLAAAYQTLSLPAIALARYLTPRLAAHRGDFLWLMNYADALEQNQDADRAWRLRRYLLAAEADGTRPGAARLVADGDSEIRRVARARLVLALHPGDAGDAVLRELLRLDRDAAGELSRGAREAVAAWFQAAGENEAERGWLWQQFARNAARPLWADIGTALASGDDEGAGRLLERYGEALPRHDRIEAERRADDLALAQSDAFETAAAEADDDSLHLQLADALLARADRASAVAARRLVGSVGEREAAARWHLALAPRLTLDLEIGSISRIDLDPAVIARAPGEHYRGAGLAWRGHAGELRLRAEERQGLAVYRPLAAEYRLRPGGGLGISVDLGTDLPSSETLALRLAGSKARLALGLSYAPGPRERLGLTYADERYRLQTGGGLGSGQHLQVEYARALRRRTPGLEAGVFWSAHRFRRDGTGPSDPAGRPLLPAGGAGPDFLIPDSFRFYGLRLATDTRLQREYGRAWRPYASVARTWHSTLGPGYELQAGVAGSVLGADHLSLGWSLGKGGQTTGALVREWGLNYDLHY